VSWMSGLQRTAYTWCVSVLFKSNFSQLLSVSIHTGAVAAGICVVMAVVVVVVIGREIC